jgi:hypothetical protein
MAAAAVDVICFFSFSEAFPAESEFPASWHKPSSPVPEMGGACSSPGVLEFASKATTAHGKEVHCPAGDAVADVIRRLFARIEEDACPALRGTVPFLLRLRQAFRRGSFESKELMVDLRVSGGRLTLNGEKE